jgi:D-serine deaminase-like pyridoxal phosphate-dependent protein
MAEAFDDKTHTPLLLLDVARMTRNLSALQAHLDDLGVPLRPHVKTCKNVEIARRMTTASSPGIAVSTLAEAEHFFANGFEDLLYAVGIAPGKLPSVAELMRRGAALKIALDGLEAARAVVEAADRLKQRFDVVIEVDSDGRRAGLKSSDPELVEAARLLDAGGCSVAGVMTHMGSSYACRDADGLARAAEHERRSAVDAATRLRDAGLAAPIVSVGSTPTARFAKDLTGVTEVRAGVHVFMDLVMAGIGVCELDDIAISVLAEVIGYRDGPGEWLIDAGWMAMSRDRGTAAQDVDFGYGAACREDGRPLDGVIVRAADQEHGIVASLDGQPLARDRFELGERVRILPNHACATAAQFDGYRLVDGNQVGGWWPRIRGW